LLYSCEQLAVESRCIGKSFIMVLEMANSSAIKLRSSLCAFQYKALDEQFAGKLLMQ